MADDNPYAAPRSKVADAAVDDAVDSERLRRIASGQRLMIISIIVSFLSVPLRAAVGPLAALIGVASLVCAVVGAVKLAGGLGHSTFARVLWGIAMIIPLVNLICMLILSSQATKLLRNGGWTVGFFGAREN